MTVTEQVVAILFHEHTTSSGKAPIIFFSSHFLAPKRIQCRPAVAYTRLPTGTHVSVLFLLGLSTVRNQRTVPLLYCTCVRSLYFFVSWSLQGVNFFPSVTSNHFYSSVLPGDSVTVAHFTAVWQVCSSPGALHCPHYLQMDRLTSAPGRHRSSLRCFRRFLLTFGVERCSPS